MERPIYVRKVLYYIRQFIYQLSFLFRRKLTLILGWLALFATAYKVTNIQHDYVAWDPFEILGIDPVCIFLYIFLHYLVLYVFNLLKMITLVVYSFVFL